MGSPRFCKSYITCMSQVELATWSLCWKCPVKTKGGRNQAQNFLFWYTNKNIQIKYKNTNSQLCSFKSKEVRTRHKTFCYSISQISRKILEGIQNIFTHRNYSFYIWKKFLLKLLAFVEESGRIKTFFKKCPKDVFFSLIRKKLEDGVAAKMCLEYE